MRPNRTRPPKHIKCDPTVSRDELCTPNHILVKNNRPTTISPHRSKKNTLAFRHRVVDVTEAEAAAIRGAHQRHIDRFHFLSFCCIQRSFVWRHSLYREWLTLWRSNDCSQNGIITEQFGNWCISHWYIEWNDEFATTMAGDRPAMYFYFRSTACYNTTRPLETAAPGSRTWSQTCYKTHHMLLPEHCSVTCHSSQGMCTISLPGKG